MLNFSQKTLKVYNLFVILDNKFLQFKENTKKIVSKKVVGQSIDQCYHKSNWFFNENFQNQIFQELNWQHVVGLFHSLLTRVVNRKQIFSRIFCGKIIMILRLKIIG